MTKKFILPAKESIIFTKILIFFTKEIKDSAYQ